MSTVEVAAAPTAEGWDCAVTVRDDGAWHYRVSVASGDLARLVPGAADPIGLVEASFAFLLEREAKESILREFDITVISRYFPDYEREIARRLTG